MVFRGIGRAILVTHPHNSIRAVVVFARIWWLSATASRRIAPFVLSQEKVANLGILYVLRLRPTVFSPRPVNATIDIVPDFSASKRRCLQMARAPSVDPACAAG